MFDKAASCDSATFQPCSERALANHKVVTDSFRSIYTINSGIAQGTGVAVGRYPEDSYYNGNPWYLATFAAAEQLYDAVYTWKRLGSLSITSTSLAFFKDIYPSAAVGTYASTTTQFTAITAAALTYADTYLQNAQRYTPQSGALAEQYDRNNGSPLSASDLTWSYAAFLTAVQARNNVMPDSWGAANARVPSSCSSGSASGPCKAATNTNWGNPGTPSTTTTAPGSPTTTNAPCASPSLTVVTFNEIATTVYGENVFLTGSIPELGNWDTTKAVALSADKYTSSNNLWYASVSLAAGGSFQYKYFRKSSAGVVKWESDPNRSYTVPRNCDGKAVVNDSFR